MLGSIHCTEPFVVGSSFNILLLYKFLFLLYFIIKYIISMSHFVVIQIFIFNILFYEFFLFGSLFTLEMNAEHLYHISMTSHGQAIVSPVN